MASLEERGDSVRVTWLLGGRRGAPKQSCTFSGPPAARLQLALAAKKVVEARGHDITRSECYDAVLGVDETPQTPMPTFNMWADEWIAELERTRQVQPAALKRYRQYLRLRAAPYFGHRRLDDIDRDTIKDWVLSMKTDRVTLGNRNRITGKRLLAPATIVKQFMIVSSCLGAAVPKWLAVNPAAPLPGERKNSIGLPAVPASDAIFLTADELARILDHCHPDLYDLVYVASRTGMRMGELLALDVRHVVFPRDGGATILVRRGVKADGSIGEPKTPASRRDVPVRGEAAEILARRTKGKRPSGLVFLSPKGRAWCSSSLRAKHWYRAVAAAQRCAEHPPPAPPKRNGPPRKLRNDEISTCGCPGLLQQRPRFHDLRHTHASALIANGWHFKKIQRRLGHARFQTTMDVYGHLIDLGGDEELEGLEGFFKPLSPVTRLADRRGSVRRRVARRTFAVPRSKSG